MGSLPLRRVAAVGAVGFIVLNIIVAAIAKSAPDYDSPPSKINAYFLDHHKALLISVVLLGIGLVLLIGTIAQTVDMIRGSGLLDAATAFAVAGAALVAILGIGTAILGSMTHMAKSGTDPGTLRAFYQAAHFMLSVPISWIALFLALPLTRVAIAGAFPRWVAPLNGLVAVLLVLGGISVRGSGALGVGTGVLPMLANLAFAVLLLEIAVLLWRSAPAGATFTRPAATPV